MRAKSLMVLGTASGVGKSFVAAGLCRLLSDWGYRVAPFKAQNMSNNSYVTEEGGEIGRAQAVQAECARLKPTVDMNPVLLKPSADDGSQVIVHGQAIGHFKAREYFSKRDQMERAIKESYERLASEYEILVIEGAGSPAEPNLKPYDLVNMHTARMADAQCLLVADIDRGGVFASLIGTLGLLDPADRERIAGLLINKFRGDASLFDEGVRFLEEMTGKKVWGVLPFDLNLWIEEEDSVFIEREQAVKKKNELDIAVLSLPRMSNFTDFEVLRHEPGVRLRYVKKAEEIGEPDLLILPGTKATVADLLYLTENGFREALSDYTQNGGRLLGICGGYQMMGDWIADPEGIESQRSKTAGLGYLKMTTEFQPEKILNRTEESLQLEFFGHKVSGKIEAYEIHMGVTRHEENYAAFGRGGAVHESGRIIGTYYHGLFDSGSFRKAFLKALAKSAGKKIQVSELSVQEIKEVHYARLREMLEAHFDLNALRNALGLHKAPSGIL
jgi:adenosylcobyric acid synthase